MDLEIGGEEDVKDGSINLDLGEAVSDLGGSVKV